ncbi:hypothetical protein [Rugosimonospora africana]|uniref:Uncharacterized protein n=1 Tax=Rugosimonospora africana TaxID=556532 RepID=A0A8J3QS63_9ACTN|nr:hypothetical protein [Rugosimonospora africana]GIH16515.1 hypothetical protein Raf01_46870 [Rugosimonospora africana]
MIADVVVVVLAVCAGAVALVVALGLTTWAQRDRVVRGAAAENATAEADLADGDPENDGTPNDGTQTDGAPDGGARNGGARNDRAQNGGTRNGRTQNDRIRNDGEDDGERVPSAADLRGQAEELAAHATAAAGRAERAMADVDTARAEYDAAEAHRDTVEAEYDAARLAYAEALRAVRAGQPEPPTPEQRERRHEVESAALAAYRRGELSIDELRAVFARAGDRDPDREALAQEAERLAARESEVRRGYDIAVAAARVAGERLHVAEVAATACTQEAVDAAIEAQVAADELGRDAERR